MWGRNILIAYNIQCVNHSQVLIYISYIYKKVTVQCDLLQRTKMLIKTSYDNWRKSTTSSCHKRSKGVLLLCSYTVQSTFRVRNIDELHFFLCRSNSFKHQGNKIPRFILRGFKGRNRLINKLPDKMLDRAQLLLHIAATCDEELGQLRT